MYFNSLSNNDINKIVLLLLFFLSISIQLLIFDYFPVSISIDSYQYITSTSDVRPHGYDVILNFLGLETFQSFAPIIIAQMFFTVSIPLILYLALKDYGLYPALLTSLISMLNIYPYTMSLQIMSESIFIFGLVLTIFLLYKYKNNPSFINFLIVCISILILNEVRQSIIAMFASLALFILCLYIKSFKKILLLHLIFVFVIFGLHYNIRSFISKTNSSNIAPFFIMHYLPQVNVEPWSFQGWDPHQIHAKIPLSNRKPILNISNGERSKIFFLELKKLFLKKDIYEQFASKTDIRGKQTELRDEFKEHNDENISKLITDLTINYEQAGHRWPQLIYRMSHFYGWEKTGGLLRGLIFEAFLKHPAFFSEIFLPKMFMELKTGRLFHDNIYWHFVPKPSNYDDYYLLNNFPLNHKVYVAWIFGQEGKTGIDESTKTGPGEYYEADHTFRLWSFSHVFAWIKDYKLSKTYISYEKLQNKTAFGIYIGTFLTRCMGFGIIMLLPLFLVFCIFVRFGLYAGCIGLSGLVMVFLGFITSLHPRQIFMFLPMFYPLMCVGISFLLKLVVEVKNLIYQKGVKYRI